MSNSLVNIHELISESAIKSTSQNDYSSKLVSLLKNADLTHASANPLKSGITEEYIPAIYVPNAESVDLSLQPIVAVGFEVDTDLSGMEEYEDYIVAWYYDEEDNLHEILLNEETALNTKNPVFIIIADIVREEADNLKKSIQNSHTKSVNTSVKKIIDEYKINYRYDKSNRSEYSYEFACVIGGR